jgi:hypothetical protein
VSRPPGSLRVKATRRAAAPIFLPNCSCVVQVAIAKHLASSGREFSTHFRPLGTAGAFRSIACVRPSWPGEPAFARPSNQSSTVDLSRQSPDFGDHIPLRELSQFFTVTGPGRLEPSSPGPLFLRFAVAVESSLDGWVKRPNASRRRTLCRRKSTAHPSRRAESRMIRKLAGARFLRLAGDRGKLRYIGRNGRADGNRVRGIFSHWNRP